MCNICSMKELLIVTLIVLSSRIHAVKFWHITDFHYDPTYEGEGTSCYSRTSGRPAFGNYLCDSPWTLVNNSVHQMKVIEPNPDFIVWTGDDTPHTADQDKFLSTEKVLNIIGNLTSLIKEVFPGTPVYSALGNHDYHRKHQMPPSTNPIYKGVADMWRPWFNNSNVANDTFTNGGFYTLPIHAGLRAIILNTVYYYTNNKLTADIDDPVGQFDWFDELMTNATRNNEKVFVIGHVPPGHFERHKTKKWFYPKFNTKFNSLIRKHASNIAAMFFAHHHTDSFRVYYDDKGSPIASMLIAPGVTPWETTLSDVIGSAANNPGLRLFNYDTPDKLDFMQYYTNLSLTYDGSEPTWSVEYQASTAYDIPDVSPTSLQKLVENMKKTNSEAFKKYYKYNSVSLKPDEDCNEMCKTIHLCAIQNVNFSDYDRCSQKTSSYWHMKANIMIVSLLIGVLFALL